MKKHLQDAISSPKFKASKLKRRMLLAALAAGSFCAMPAMAQNNLDYKVAAAVNTTGTYTDLGTSGTAITVANNDDANSAAVPIGFSFNFNGTNFTDFSLNTNGFIKLGTTAISSQTAYENIYAATDANLISPLSGVDLHGAADQTANPTEFRVVTTGTSPNQVTTIQFKNLSDKPTALTPTVTVPTQFATINFQIKLYEGTNNIEFVYGPWTASTNPASPAGQWFVVGLKGAATGAAADRALASKDTPSKTWAQTIFETTYFSQGNPYLPSVVVMNSAMPDAGRTFRFVKYSVPANDLSVETIFSQGQVALASGTPHEVKAVIKNTGTATATNKTITLDVSGTHTVSSTTTITSLAPNATTVVTFPPFSLSATGTNSIEVSVPNDDNNSNDVKGFNQVVTANTESYAVIDPGAAAPRAQTVFPAPYGNTHATNSGVYLSRFYATNRLKVNSLRTFIAGPAFNSNVHNANRTVYAIVLDANGNQLARSADVTLTLADEDNFMDFIFNTPAVVENEYYFIGLGLVAMPTATSYSYPFAAQNEDADRSGAYFRVPTPGANPVKPVDYISDSRLLFEANITNITGVKEDLNSKLVSVYPNPSNGVFNVSAKDMKGANLNLEVRDMQGRVVYSAPASKDNATIDLKNIASGVYMLKASTDAEVAVKRIVVR